MLRWFYVALYLLYMYDKNKSIKDRVQIIYYHYKRYKDPYSYRTVYPLLLYYNSIYYPSYRSASIGFNLLALFAGYKPNTTSITKEKFTTKSAVLPGITRVMPIILDRIIISIHAINSPKHPPIKLLSKIGSIYPPLLLLLRFLYL